jgi:mRNA interferase RelE/StbE
MLKLDLSNEAMRLVETLAGKQYKQVVGTMIGLLKEPTPHDSRALVGYPYRRVDVGEYRIVYDVQADTLRVLVVEKRNDDAVYKALKRK